MRIENRPCTHCFDLYEVHVGDKCVFGPTNFEGCSVKKLEEFFSRNRDGALELGIVRFVRRTRWQREEVFLVQENISYRQRDDYPGANLREVAYMVKDIIEAIRG